MSRKKQKDGNRPMMSTKGPSSLLMDDGNEMLSRRRLLKSATVAAGALAATMLPRIAEAADGDPVILG